jgi:hypothetical protein
MLYYRQQTTRDTVVIVHTASTSHPLLMSLNLRDTGCVGDQTVRNPWEWGLVETPLKHCCDKLYCATVTTHNWLPINSTQYPQLTPPHSMSTWMNSIPTTTNCWVSWLKTPSVQLIKFSQLPQLYNLGTDRKERQQLSIAACLSRY